MVALLLDQRLQLDQDGVVLSDVLYCLLPEFAVHLFHGGVVLE